MFSPLTPCQYAAGASIIRRRFARWKMNGYGAPVENAIIGSSSAIYTDDLAARSPDTLRAYDRKLRARSNNRLISFAGFEQQIVVVITSSNNHRAPILQYYYASPNARETVYCTLRRPTSYYYFLVDNSSSYYIYIYMYIFEYNTRAIHETPLFFQYIYILCSFPFVSRTRFIRF